MKLKLKTATLIAMIATGLYSILQIIFVFTKFLYWFDGQSALYTLIQIFVSIALFLFFYSLYQNQKK